MIIEFHLPSNTLENDFLEETYDNPKWTASKVYRKTGIKSRPIVSEQLVSDLAVSAAEKLFQKSGIEREDISFLILCTQSPDHFLPPTSCIVQNRLELSPSVGALDMSLGCSGYVYGLAVAKGLLMAQVARKVLFITSETYSRYIHSLDRSTRTIFGDAAAATLITSDDLNSIGNFVLGTDGSGAENLIVPAGGMALPRSSETSIDEADSQGNIRSKNNLFMNGPEIFSFTLRTVPDLIDRTLGQNNLGIEDIDLFVFHQANRFILETLREKCGIPENKYVIDVEETGNTVSCSIPIAIRRAFDRGQLKPGDRILIAGFGVGYSWGATVLKF